jgi:hypothetical protein
MAIEYKNPEEEKGHSKTYTPEERLKMACQIAPCINPPKFFDHDRKTAWAECLLNLVDYLIDASEEL